MGKKKSVPAAEAPKSEPFHTAFSGLASLRDELPSLESPDPGSEPNAESTPDTSAASPKIVLQREKKGRAGKTVTRVRGLASPEDRLHWAKRLKKELGCGATIEGEDVILLGDVGEPAKTRLEAGGFRRVVLGQRSVPGGRDA
jgi:translation initiation factor 1 (eIF-1/SUI1)